MGLSLSSHLLYIFMGLENEVNYWDSKSTQFSRITEGSCEKCLGGEFPRIALDIGIQQKLKMQVVEGL